MPSTATVSRRLPGRPLGSLAGLVRAVGFWLAIALPIGYLPLLTLAPATLADPASIGAVVATNLLAIGVGHGHEPSAGRSD